jgi:hypothetical protein
MQQRFGEFGKSAEARNIDLALRDLLALSAQPFEPVGSIDALCRQNDALPFCPLPRFRRGPLYVTIVTFQIAKVILAAAALDLPDATGQKNSILDMGANEFEQHIRQVGRAHLQDKVPRRDCITESGHLIRPWVQLGSKAPAVPLPFRSGSVGNAGRSGGTRTPNPRFWRP